MSLRNKLLVLLILMLFIFSVVNCSSKEKDKEKIATAVRKLCTLCYNVGHGQYGEDKSCGEARSMAESVINDIKLDEESKNTLYSSCEESCKIGAKDKQTGGSNLDRILSAIEPSFRK